MFFYNNVGIDNVEILDIKKLKFEGMKTKDIKKAFIRDVVFKSDEKLYLQNKISNITALLPRAVTLLLQYQTVLFQRAIQ